MIDLAREMARIKGVYVPSLYTLEYNADGTLKSFEPIAPEASRRIQRRFV